jgi:hypothetical protein
MLDKRLGRPRPDPDNRGCIMIRTVNEPAARRAQAAVLLATAALVNGCVSTGDLQGTAASGLSALTSGIGITGADAAPTPSASAQPLTPAEERMRQQSKAFQKTVWEGVLIGASAGTLWGVIQGDKAKDVLTKAVIGGAVGGLAGAYIGHKQNQFSSKEDQLDSMIADVKQSNRDTEELIVSVRQVIAEDKKRLAAVEQRFRKGQATKVEVDGTRSRIKENQTVIAQASKGAHQKQSMFQGAEQQFKKDNPGTDTARMQREIDAYNKHLKTLDGLAGSVAVA